ncbi:hypothetical protein GQ55_4G347800 [Panicum hallii var. hallii]|uniref:KIB1-4 beta-propeller domain-containing protein n=1 Tax=Panicum hallii var. hallii TaxID=1504633 RepID=A0A2T7E3D4_9POAL|nr:hypothetical protein GQ55_4G347800 [Panicum hallii var. hallii]
MAAAVIPAPTLPCLVFDYDGEQQRTTLFSISDGAHRACEIEELRGKRSWPTSHGWPPPLRSVCARSGDPCTAAGGRCTVLLAEPPQSTILWYCQAGGTAWTRHEYDLGSASIRVPEGNAWCKRTVNRLASCQGRFYYPHSSTQCGVIGFSPARLPELSTVPMKMGGLMAAAATYIVEIGGDLHTVYVFRHGIDFTAVADVGVYRMDFARQEHVRVESIGDRAILAGSGSCFGGWCPATEFGLLPNTVYWMSSVDDRLHVFDIEVGAEEVHEPCKGVAVPSRKPFWIIPAHP